MVVTARESGQSKASRAARRPHSEPAMSIQAILLPLFVEVLLTFGLMLWMGRARIGSVTTGQVKVRDIALGQSAWPERVQQVSNAYHNQFQMPVLFYVLTILAIVTRQADLLFVVMAWLFVLLRVGHAAVHVTSNRVSRRFFIFLAGTIVLLLMWIIFAVRILLAI
jgi:hypothetical protein